MRQHHQQRLSALRTLAKLVEQHQLATPREIRFLDTDDIRPPYVEMTLDDDQADEATHWAAILGMPEPDHRRSRLDTGQDITLVMSERFATEPFWCGFGYLRVKSVCARKDATREAGAL